MAALFLRGAALRTPMAVRGPMSRRCTVRTFAVGKKELVELVKARANAALPAKADPMTTVQVDAAVRPPHEQPRSGGDHFAMRDDARRVETRHGRPSREEIVQLSHGLSDPLRTYPIGGSRIWVLRRPRRA